MIASRKELYEYIALETKNIENRILLYLPFDLYEKQIILKFLILLRKTEYYHNKNYIFLKYFYLIRLKRKQNRYGLHIPINVFGKGLSIAHLGTIVVNGNCSIGENCRIHVGVVIGSNGKNYKGGVPVLGDNIYIAPGAKIFGNIKIANGCRIGANAVVNKNCNIENATLVGVPAKIITKDIEGNE